MTELNVRETGDTGEPLTEDKTLENLTRCLSEIKNRTLDDISDITPLGESKSAAYPIHKKYSAAYSNFREFRYL